MTRDNITLPRATVEQALEALNSLAAAQLADGTYADKDCKVTLAITALRAVLSRPSPATLFDPRGSLGEPIV